MYYIITHRMFKISHHHRCQNTTLTQLHKVHVYLIILYTMRLVKEVTCTSIGFQQGNDKELTLAIGVFFGEPV